MGKTIGLIVVALWVAVVVEVGWGWDGDAMDDAKERANLAAENARVSAEEAMQDANEQTESWTDWALDRISEGLGFKQGDAREVAQDMMSKAGDTASRTADLMNSAASKASDYTSQRADEAANMGDEVIRMATDKTDDTRETMEGAMRHGRDQVANAYDQAKENLNSASNVAKDQAYDETAGKVTYGTHDYLEAAKAYEEAKNYLDAARAYEESRYNVGESYKIAEDTMSENSKAYYEAAKEKASQAAGDLGSRMRTDGSEL